MKKARFTYIIGYYVSEGVLIYSPREYHSTDAVFNNLYRYKDIGELKIIDNEFCKTRIITGYYSILNFLNRT